MVNLSKQEKLKIFYDTMEDYMIDNGYAKAYECFYKVENDLLKYIQLEVTDRFAFCGFSIYPLFMKTMGPYKSAGTSIEGFKYNTKSKGWFQFDASAERMKQDCAEMLAVIKEKKILEYMSSIRDVDGLIKIHEELDKNYRKTRKSPSEDGGSEILAYAYMYKRNKKKTIEHFERCIRYFYTPMIYPDHILNDVKRLKPQLYQEMLESQKKPRPLDETSKMWLALYQGYVDRLKKDDFSQVGEIINESRELQAKALKVKTL